MDILKKLLYKTEVGIDKIKFQIKDKLNLNNPVIIYPFRGFGTPKKVHLHGRVLEKEDIIHAPVDMDDSIWTNLKKVWKRYESDEVPKVEVKGTFHGATARAVSDDEGYFTLIFEGMSFNTLLNGWHSVELEIEHMPFDIEYEATTSAEVLISNQINNFGIISDIDDTIIESDILNPIKKVANVLLKNEKERIVFEGVQELYTKLSKDFQNPLLFVSGSSYNLFDMLTYFCAYNNIPKAPFIMRDIGLGLTQWIVQDSLEYKKNRIEHILNIYPKLNFILIGDSGEKDPEIYLDIHENYPGRIMAIYIRHVNSDLRKSEIDERTKDLDIPFLLLKDTERAMEHSKKMGWI